MKEIYAFRHRRDNMSFEHVTFEDLPTNDDINVFKYYNVVNILW